VAIVYPGDAEVRRLATRDSATQPLIAATVARLASRNEPRSRALCD
jgi:hypothetical protein